MNITGTPYTLRYQSDRVPGYKVAATLNIPLSAESVPAELIRIDRIIDISGRRFVKSVAPAPNISDTFIWDGKDAYGRTVQGSVPVFVNIGFVYQSVRYQSAAEVQQSFGRFSGVPFSFSSNRRQVTLSQRWQASIGSWDAQPLGLGGWTLNVGDKPSI